MKRFKIGIVGGSLAACSAAILLMRDGHTVQVFERSKSQLVGRGGGIGTSGQMFRQLCDENVVEKEMPHLSIDYFPFIIKSAEDEQFGYIPWRAKTELISFHWSTLWNSLRSKVPDENYHSGMEVINVSNEKFNTATIHFTDGRMADFDLVLFADGYQSLGRKLLFPTSEIQYRGYMLWRGLLPEKEIEHSFPMEANCPRIWYPNMDGNLVLYFIPGFDGQISKGNRIYNWAAYIPLSEKDLPQFMKDREGIPHTGSIPPGYMRLEEENRLKQMMQENLPVYYANIIEKTKNTYVQLIYTSSLSSYHKGSIGLIGDAGMIVQPFTGSGIFKGYNNASDLVKALNSYNLLEESLEHWSQQQVVVGNHLLAHGEQLEKAFIDRSFDLASADNNSVSDWWKNIVTPPKEFSIPVNDE